MTARKCGMARSDGYRIAYGLVNLLQTRSTGLQKVQKAAPLHLVRAILHGLRVTCPQRIRVRLPSRDASESAPSCSSDRGGSLYDPVCNWLNTVLVLVYLLYVSIENVTLTLLLAPTQYMQRDCTFCLRSSICLEDSVCSHTDTQLLAVSCTIEDGFKKGTANPKVRDL